MGEQEEEGVESRTTGAHHLLAQLGIQQPIREGTSRAPTPSVDTYHLPNHPPAYHLPSTCLSAVYLLLTHTPTHVSIICQHTIWLPSRSLATHSPTCSPSVVCTSPPICPHRAVQQGEGRGWHPARPLPGHRPVQGCLLRPTQGAGCQGPGWAHLPPSTHLPL